MIKPDLARKTIELKEFLKTRKPDLRSSSSLMIKKEKLPKISIVTPSYNQAKYIERTILSVLNQNYPKLEYIIIDGGSNDGTLEIIKKYESEIAYWVSEKDRGQTHAINKGLRLATGDLVAFQNSDDVYLPGAFTTVALAYMLKPDVDVIYGDFFHIDKHDNIIDEQLLIQARLWMQVYLGPQIHNQAAFWKRKLHVDLGFLDESYIFDMDYEFFSRLLAKRCIVQHLPTHLGAFRHHPEAKTSQLQDVSRKELIEVAEIYKPKCPVLFRQMPWSFGRIVAKCIKSICHLSKGRVDYVFRKRICFK